MKMDFKLEGRQLIWDYLLLTVGALLTAFAFAAFFVTNDIAPGGVTGIATVLSSVTGLNVGLLSFLINVPLFAIGWRRVGVRFAVRSFISMLLLSLFIDLMPEFDLAGNMMLAAIFGGVTMGAGLGMVVRAGATTGGNTRPLWSPCAMMSAPMSRVDTPHDVVYPYLCVPSLSRN